MRESKKNGQEGLFRPREGAGETQQCVVKMPSELPTCWGNNGYVKTTRKDSPSIFSAILDGSSLWTGQASQQRRSQRTGYPPRS